MLVSEVIIKCPSPDQPCMPFHLNTNIQVQDNIQITCDCVTLPITCDFIVALDSECPRYLEGPVLGTQNPDPSRITPNYCRAMNATEAHSKYYHLGPRNELLRVVDCLHQACGWACGRNAGVQLRHLEQAPSQSRACSF